MSYATLIDLEDSGLPPGALASVGVDAKHKALERASGVADSFLRDQYTLPLSEPYDESLVEAVCAIAAWRLMCRRGFNPSIPGDTVVRVGYEDAMTFLKALANGQRRIATIQALPEHEEPMVSTSSGRGYLADDGCVDSIGPNGAGF